MWDLSGIGWTFVKSARDKATRVQDVISDAREWPNWFGGVALYISAAC